MDDMKAYDSLQGELAMYEAFFRRRAEVESEYADALKKLAFKQQELDRRFDEEQAPEKRPETTCKKAYMQLRNSLFEESAVHQAFSDRTKAIVATLASFRDNKDRMRRRIKDDLRAITHEHAEYKSTVSRLRKAYEHKVDEVRSHEEAVDDSPTSSTSSASNANHQPWPPEHWDLNNASANAQASATTPGSGRERSESATSSRGGRHASEHAKDRDSADLTTAPSPSISPQPPSAPQVFVSGATSTTLSHTSNPSAPGAAKPNNVFESIAKRDWSGDKQRVNSIVRAVGNLAKGEGGAVKPSGLKSVKARQASNRLRREAEQADRDYRNGIFRLETLRLQKERINRSAATSLREFALEFSSTMKEQSAKFLSAITNLGSRTMEIAERIEPEICEIDPAIDVASFARQLKEASAPEKPIYYQNAFVGECKNLLFGVSLNDYLSTHPNQFVPVIVKMCIEQIERTGLAQEGIYRIPGKLATVQQLVHQMEKSEIDFTFESRVDPATVAGLLKLYLRQLPSPLFPFPLQDRIAFSQDFVEHADKSESLLNALRGRLRRLDNAQQATLKALCTHLVKVTDHVSENKMGAANLGLVFSPVVFGEEDISSLESAKSSSKDVVMELLIVHCRVLFDGLPQDHAASGKIPATSGPTSKPQLTVRNAIPSPTPSPEPRRAEVEPPPTLTMDDTLARSAEVAAGRSHDSVYDLYANHASTLVPSPSPSPNPSPGYSTPAKSSPTRRYAPQSLPTPSPAVYHAEPVSFSSSNDDLGSPTPPLSAAGGRRIVDPESSRPPPVSSRSSSGPSGSMPPGWDGTSDGKQ